MEQYGVFEYGPSIGNPDRALFPNVIARSGSRLLFFVSEPIIRPIYSTPTLIAATTSPSWGPHEAHSGMPNTHSQSLFNSSMFARGGNMIAVKGHGSSSMCGG
jgi:hypothetical protein